MALSNYTTLKAAVADWLNRGDLTSQIPDFIALAEAEMQRQLRRAKTLDTLAISASPTALPAACDELTSLRLTTAEAHRDLPIAIVTLEQLAEVRARTGGVTGRPTHATVIDAELHFAPAPDQTYTAQIAYYEAIAPLSDAASTNRILTEAPDAYLYGALAHAEPYLQHDERVPVWRSRFEAAVLQLNERRAREEFGASLRPARLPRVFG